MTKIAIIGITGAVGQTFVKVLEERKIKADYYLFASARSAGKKVSVMGKQLTVIELNAENVRAVKPDFALFSACGDISKQFAPLFVELGCTVIDNSSAFRAEPNIALVVPECNMDDAIKNYKSRGNRGIIVANPNCSTIPCMVVLKPLHDMYKLKRVIYNTYQAVSGAGQEGINDYHAGLRGEPPKKFVHPIVSNLIPHIDAFLDNGNTKEEEKMINESRRILHHPKLSVSATTVRVPIQNCHSISVNAEFEKQPDIVTIKKILGNMDGVILADDTAKNMYPMPLLADDRDEVFVGRIRPDNSHPNTINMFVTCDNIRKGAATNAVQILQLLMTNDK